LVLDRSARVYGLVMLGVTVLASWCGVFRLGRDAGVARSMPFMYAGMSDAPKAPLDLAESESPSFSLCLPKCFQPGIAPLGARIIRRLVPSIALFSL
jgi:hypothetical protein